MSNQVNEGRDPDLDEPETSLEAATRRIRRVEQLIRNQLDVIASLRSDGHRTEIAIETLRVLEDTLARNREAADRLIVRKRRHA